MKCLSLHSANIAQDHRWHWEYICGKKIQGKKACRLKAKNMVQNYSPSIKNARTYVYNICM